MSEKMKKIGMSNEQITEELKTLTNYPRFMDFTNYWYFDEWNASSRRCFKIYNFNNW